MKKIIFFAVFIFLIMEIVFVEAYSAIKTDNSQEVVINPQDNNRTFFLYENHILSFTDYWGNFTAGKYNITTEIYPVPPGYNITHWYWVNELFISTLMPGAEMPWVSGINQRINTTFIWGPGGYCWDGDYIFQTRYWLNNQLAYTNITEIYVINVNRPPTITSYLPTDISVPVGGNIYFSLQATDLDRTQCGEDALTWDWFFSSVFTFPSFIDNGDGTATFSWHPTSSDIGDSQLTFTVHDIFGGTAQKSINVKVYQPAIGGGSSDCYYKKKFLMVCH